ncbi:MAG: MCE family protein [Burkholderiales bacterium]|nr:MAG: MCE family protein [Burkholderiales bacterium]
MKGRARYALLGAFVLGALVILSVAGAVFFGGQFAIDRVQALMVFRGRVTGLDVGTPVQVRGIPIGEVRRIRTLYDPASKQVLFVVYARFSGTIEVQHDLPTGFGEDAGAWLADMIERGLRAQLQTKSWVTGQQMIMLDFRPEEPARLSGLEPGTIEIPTVLSPNEELLAQLSEIPVQELLSEGRAALIGVRGLLSEPDGRPGPLPRMLDELTRVARDLGERLPRIETEFADTAAAARRTLAETSSTLAAARGAVEDARQAIADTRRTLAAIGGTSQALGRQIERSADSLVAATGDFERLSERIGQSLDRIDQSIGRFEHALSQDAPMGSALVSSLNEFGQAARALRTLSEGLERQLNSLVAGRRGESR